MLLQMPGPTPTAQGRTRRTTLTLVLLAAGIAILAWTVERLDLTRDTIQEGFSNVGWWFTAILALSFIRFALRARAWIALTGLNIPLGSAIAATISGDALGNVTPLGLVASEPAKALYLRRHADPAHTFPALVAENFFYSVSVAVYVIVAAGAMFVFFDLPTPVQVAGQLSLAGMAAVLAGAAWLAWQKPAVASAIVSRLPFGLARFANTVRGFEQQTYGAVSHARGTLTMVFLCETSFHLVSLAECWLTFWLLAGETSLLPALVFDGFNRVVNVVARPVPMRMGVEESGTALLAQAIGLVPHDGFMLGIVRKLRMIVWAGVGLVLWARRESGGRVVTGDEERRPT
jgi:hypothetical protein